MTAATGNPDRLYDLLPALYRIADTDENQQLRALLGLLAAQADDLQNDINQLWNDFFIETCQSWVIPYIGDLVGNLPIHDLDSSAAAATAEALFTDLAGPDLQAPGAIRTRADVARTIYYRRRKGTPAMLEELATDVTGWGAHVVEFFQILDWNQHLEHLRPECVGCPDLRRVDTDDRVGGAWDVTTHTVDVRAINQSDGWYNVQNLGFFLWRLGAYALTHVTPRPIGGTTWRYTFSPLGQNMALFSPGTRPPGASGIATELTVPLPIRAAAFYEDLSAASPPAPGTDLLTGYYGGPGDPGGGALAVYIQTGPPTGPFQYTQINDVQCLNLENWDAIPSQPTGKTVGIDPTRGRFIIGDGLNGETLAVSYHYGYSAPMGGGEYARAKWLVPPDSHHVTKVTQGMDLNQLVGSARSNPGYTPQNPGYTILEIGDDGTYQISSPITVFSNESLVIQAADGCRPLIRLANGSVQVGSDPGAGSLTLGGLLVEGGFLINGDLPAVRLLHSTLIPGRSVEQELPGAPFGPSLIVSAGSAGNVINADLEVEIAFSIVGALRIPSTISKLWLLDSIVDGIERDGAKIDSTTFAVSDATLSNGPPAHIERCTVLGNCRFLKLELASESIFDGTVTVDERQAGCVRFSFVAAGSQTPQQYRCQPALEIESEIARIKAEAIQTETALPPGWDVQLTDEITAWLVPAFESVQYGNAAFAQLRLRCPVQVRTGAADGSEMGAFCLLKQPQREANLRIRLDEYLPVGLDAGVIYVT